MSAIEKCIKVVEGDREFDMTIEARAELTRLRRLADLVEKDGEDGVLVRVLQSCHDYLESTKGYEEYIQQELDAFEALATARRAMEVPCD